MKHLLSNTAFGLSLAISASTISLAQESGDVLVSPVSTFETTAELPTLREAFAAFGGEVNGLNSDLLSTRRSYTECLAQAVRDAGEPSAPIGRRTCDIVYETDLIDWAENAQDVFSGGAVAMWMQVELLGTDLDELSQEARTIARSLSEAQIAEEIAIEAARALYSEIGEPTTQQEIEQFDELSVAVELARIHQEGHEGALAANAAMAEQSDALRVVLDELAYALEAVSRRQVLRIARSEARLQAFHNHARWTERGGSQAMPPELDTILETIQGILEMSGEDRSVVPGVEPNGAPVTAHPSLNLELGHGFAFFQQIFEGEDTSDAEEVTQ